MIKKWLKIGRTDLIAAILGVLLVFSFAPFGIYPFAIIALAGLLALILNASPKRAAFIGFIFGLGLFGAGVYWIYISIHDYGDVPPWLAGLITAGLIAILALFPAATCYGTNRFFKENNTRKYIFAFPAMWLISEWTRSWVVCGFTWLFLGYSQTNSPLRGYAPFLSVYGVSLMLLMASGFIVSAWQHYQQKTFRKLYNDLFALALIWVVGALLSLIPWTSKAGEPITVSLVQGNIPQSIKWSREYLNLSYDRYEQLSEPNWGKSQLIIWPEAAIPTTMQDANEFLTSIQKKALQSNTRLLLGIPLERSEAEGGGYYNAVIALGKERNMYVKRRLVPYGEYVPFQALSAKLLNFMNVPMSDMQAGGNNQPPITLLGVKFNTSICFEITFPELIYTHDETFGILLTVTNDAWFNDSIAQAQHLQMAAMRAIELARPVLFVSNDGITAIIGPHGNIEAQAPAHVPYVLTGKVQAMTGLTPWMTNSLDPLFVLVVTFILLARRPSKSITPLQPIAKIQ